jgi:hypothetical protein
MTQTVTCTAAAEPEQPKSRAGWIRILVVVVAAGVLVAATGPPSNGTVVLDSTLPGSTLFNLVGLNGGQSFQSCSVDGPITSASVVLHGADGGGGLAQYLDLRIEIGTGTSFTPGDTGCSGFTDAQEIFTGTLASFVTTHSNVSSGLDATWSSAATGEVHAFRFTLTVQDTNDAQGKSAAPTFTWETSPPA